MKVIFSHADLGVSAERTNCINWEIFWPPPGFPLQSFFAKKGFSLQSLTQTPSYDKLVDIKTLSALDCQTNLTI